ncbi:MAG TPA: serine/threonine-protein kinase [Polyangia bacterium]|nr:serine/threonine-protein kinase [Polyangia bacterium]
MNDGSPQPPPSDALVGHTLVDRYRLTRKIGEGGMGAVYEAMHVLLSKPVAVKVLRDKYLDRPEVARRLVQEARLASSIRHENIVDITDSGATEDGRTFVVMEHLEGLSLAELLKREGALPEARIIEIARQAASALGAAHECGIVHRDVKPENIFLIDRDSGRGGRDFVKVLDFGISKTIKPGTMDEESLKLTHTGMVLGTPLYMSPEQARGDEDLDHRIDIWALGVILYECLTAEVPFRATNYLGVIAQVLNQDVTPPRKLRPEMRISEPMERVVQKAMAKSRDDRYPTMAALVDDLDRVASGGDVEPPRVTPSTAERPRTTLWLAAVGVLAGTAGLLAIDRFTRAPEAPQPTQMKTAADSVTSQPKTPAPPPAPKTVVLHVETTPPGAEIRQGSRVFGAAPRDILLPRSEVPATLTFRLDGYEDGTTQVVPTTDDTLRVKLTAHAKSHHARSAETKAATPGKQPTEQPPTGETLPNPY